MEKQNTDILQLEKPLQELHNRIAELEIAARQPTSAALKTASHKNIAGELRDLEQQFKTMAGQIFADLTPYQITQLSRHPNRPYTLDIINTICTDFVEIHGDRNFMDDKSIVTGVAQFRGHRVVVIGHQKGRGTKENVKRNFGMPRPEGYRKALRVMNMAANSYFYR
jgi:acetyl-CoA carboxylase carboxyl transferase subunit alpha